MINFQSDMAQNKLEAYKQITEYINNVLHLSDIVDSKEINAIYPNLSARNKKGSLTANTIDLVFQEIENPDSLNWSFGNKITHGALATRNDIGTPLWKDGDAALVLYAQHSPISFTATLNLNLTSYDIHTRFKTYVTNALKGNNGHIFSLSIPEILPRPLVKLIEFYYKQRVSLHSEMSFTDYFNNFSVGGELGVATLKSKNTNEFIYKEETSSVIIEFQDDQDTFEKEGSGAGERFNTTMTFKGQFMVNDQYTLFIPAVVENQFSDPNLIRHYEDFNFQDTSIIRIPRYDCTHPTLRENIRLSIAFTLDDNETTIDTHELGAVELHWAVKNMLMEQVPMDTINGRGVFNIELWCNGGRIADNNIVKFDGRYLTLRTYRKDMRFHFVIYENQDPHRLTQTSLNVLRKYSWFISSYSYERYRYCQSQGYTREYACPKLSSFMRKLYKEFNIDKFLKQLVLDKEIDERFLYMEYLEFNAVMDFMINTYADKTREKKIFQLVLDMAKSNGIDYPEDIYNCVKTYDPHDLGYGDRYGYVSKGIRYVFIIDRAEKDQFNLERKFKGRGFTL